VKEELGRAHAAGNEEAVAAVLARFERRRGSLSQFMKELKMRMTRYMNKRLNRTGTLWESRYKSVLVEGSELALLTVAAYIDLNPVRAGIVDRPEDYHWCGYSEAISGTRGAKRARQASGVLDPNRESGARKMRGANWGELRTYRDLRKDVIG